MEIGDKVISQIYGVGEVYKLDYERITFHFKNGELNCFSKHYLSNQKLEDVLKNNLIEPYPNRNVFLENNIKKSEVYISNWEYIKNHTDSLKNENNR